MLHRYLENSEGVTRASYIPRCLSTSVIHFFKEIYICQKVPDQLLRCRDGMFPSTTARCRRLRKQSDVQFKSCFQQPLKEFKIERTSLQVLLRRHASHGQLTIKVDPISTRRFVDLPWFWYPRFSMIERISDQV